ncbi:MAG: hypothetical protein CL691_01265 [Cellvibrionales bacterium]|nr:hypothetical protein [Cellvibrionales bacterium]|tara:strand:+ start:6630 stop:6980 length:351 start_codon:yes stop_codon:yes gene_type:complete
MSFNIADVFELAVDHYAKREYVVCDQQRRTYAEMESRANQLAHYLQKQSIGLGDHVGIYAMNCVEWGEAIKIHCRTKLAAYKIPRRIHYVDSIPRSPSGKPDYQWAINIAQNKLIK